MKSSQIAAQLYTVRNMCQIPRDIASTLKKIRSIGYTSVQVSGLGPIDTTELVSMLQGEGLTCCITHESAADLFDNPAKCIERLRLLKCTNIAYPYPSGVEFTDMKTVDDFSARLEKTGMFFAEHGISFSYHNHNIEFLKIDGTTVLDLIFAKTNPRHVQSELDTYWVQAGGGDPAAWCSRLKGRLPCIHLKDYAMSRKERRAVMAEIGLGNLDWHRIIPAALESGCTWFIVEQDSDWSTGDPLESLRISYDYLVSNHVD